MAEFRHISWGEYGELAERLVGKLQKSKGFDLVVGVARGGIPIAMVVSDEMDVKWDIINVKSYAGIAKRERPKIISTLTEKVKGKNVLVVDDLVDEGATMETIVGYLSKEKPRRVSTAVLFKKPWSKFEPDFYLETLEQWVVFPWEHGEVRRILAKEKRTRS